MVIVRNGITTWVQILDKAVYITLCSNAFEKCMKLSLPPQAMDK